MEKPAKYVIFRTRWGYFGLVAAEKGLRRTCLPGPRYQQVKARLLKDIHCTQFDKNLLKPVQRAICAYFQGERTEFGPEIPVDFGGLSGFYSSVLGGCRQVQFGRTITYGKLAGLLGRPAAARAVANALARNPLPLIIPCHRVVRSDGGLGGFSAPGGKALKARLLRHEYCLANPLSLRCK